MSGEKKDEKPDKVKEGLSRYSLVDERYEIIGGVRYDFLSSPKYVHQRVLGELLVAFHAACASDGLILPVPMDVHFDEDNILQPGRRVRGRLACRIDDRGRSCCHRAAGCRRVASLFRFGA